jgi:hypothetical protein
MDNKDILKGRITRQLAKWKNAISDLTAKIEVAEETAKTKLRRQLDNLHDKRVQAEKKLEEISTTSQEAWDSVKAGFEQEWADLTRTAKTAARKVRQPMAHPNRDEEIRQIAYHLWLNEGCPHGRHLYHWFQAESIWREQQAANPLEKIQPSKAKSKRKAGAATTRIKNPAGKTKRAGRPNKRGTDMP